MHQRAPLLISLAVATSACATVTPLRLDVTAAVRGIRAIAVLPPHFTWPVSGVEVWAAIHHTSDGICRRSRAAIIDPREITLPGSRLPPAEKFWAATDISSVASRTGLTVGQVLLLQPVIDRRTKQVQIQGPRGSVFAKAIEYHVRFDLLIGAKTVGVVNTHRSLAPLEAAIMEDQMLVWVDAIAEATGLLATELKRLQLIQVELPTNLREGVASMASTSLPGLSSPIAIPDTLRRLTEMNRLMGIANLKLRGRELEKALDLQPGLRVTADGEGLKAGDLLLSAETLPLRSPLTLARLRAAGPVHLEVLRGNKIINILLEGL